MSTKQYIGKQLIKEVVFTDKNANVTFKNDEKMEIPKKVYDLVVTGDIQDGEFIDIVYDKVARHIIAELAEFDLPFLATEKLLYRVSNIADNLYKIAIAKKFGVEHDHDIKIQQVLDS